MTPEYLLTSMCFSQIKSNTKVTLIKSNTATLKIYSQLTLKTPRAFVGINVKYSWLAVRYSSLYSTEELYPTAQRTGKSCKCTREAALRQAATSTALWKCISWLNPVFLALLKTLYFG